MDPRALRRLIAVVPQEPVIFAASVLDNRRYGARASRDEVIAACTKAFALESSTVCRRESTPRSASAA